MKKVFKVSKLIAESRNGRDLTTEDVYFSGFEGIYFDSYEDAEKYAKENLPVYTEECHYIYTLYNHYGYIIDEILLNDDGEEAEYLNQELFYETCEDDELQ